MTREEKKALNELTNDEELVIKPADKGGAIVVQDKEKYKKEILSQLSNETYYKKLLSNPTVSFQREICSYLENAVTQGWITKPEYDFLYCKHPIIPVFYTLPKIHKSLESPPGRPIVSQMNSLLSPLSEYVDFFIKQYVQSLPAYIKDSTDFINKISAVKDLPTDVYLLTLDVTSLYTNIPHEEGIQAMNFYLQNRTETEKPPNEFISALTVFVMKYNFFRFENDFYQQILGTSMGTICAPNYANLYMSLSISMNLYSEIL